MSVPANTEAGSYPIIIKTLYDNDRKKTEKTVTLTVNDCATNKAQTQGKGETSEGEDVEVIGSTTGSTVTTVVKSPPAGATVTQESLLKSNGFVTGIIIAEIIAVVVGIVLVISLFRRRG